MGRKLPGTLHKSDSLDFDYAVETSSASRLLIVFSITEVVIVL